MTGCGSAWLERLVWDQEVAGSNPVTPIFIIQYDMREWLSGGVSPCQGEGRGFESRLALFLLAGISLVYKGFQPFVLSSCFIMDRNPAAMKGSGSSKLEVSGYKIFLLSRLGFPG